MKFILKILFAPLMLVLYVFTNVCNLTIHISAVVMALAAVIFAASGILYFTEGNTFNGWAGLVIAFLLSPWGLPTLATWILARFLSCGCGCRRLSLVIEEHR